DQPDLYVDYLNALKSIRSKMNQHFANQRTTLKDFVDFISTARQAGIAINRLSKKQTSSQAVNLMTAHSSKGLEFETVYVHNAVESVWGSKSSKRNRFIDYPENLP